MRKHVEGETSKICTKCKVEKSIAEFYKTRRDDRSVLQSQCRLCMNGFIKQHYYAHPVKHMLRRASSRSKSKGIEFCLKETDIAPLPTHCPVFGLELTRGNGQQDPAGYSLDRLDNRKGYIPGNVVVMSYLANRLKNDGTAAQHARLAEWMCAMENPHAFQATAGVSAGLL
jgi:hypothetical protein